MLNLFQTDLQGLCIVKLSLCVCFPNVLPDQVEDRALANGTGKNTSKVETNSICASCSNKGCSIIAMSSFGPAARESPPIANGDMGRPEPLSDNAGVEEADAIEDVARLCLCLWIRGNIYCTQESKN